ncbi:MAG: hypothetical protein Q9184_001615 [Pyrenodesmia sp. 2 TL-2023]
MQTLWSRIARHRSTRNCSASFSSAAIIGRSTTATVRRRIGLDDVFTAFLSTVAFASAIADGNRRAARQQEWVTEIDQARSELDAVKADQERRISRLGPAVRPSSEAGYPPIGSANLQTWQDVFTWAEEEICERKALGFEAWKGIPLRVLRDAPRGQIQEFLAESLHCFPKFKGLSDQDVWNSVSWPLHIKKVRTLEWSVARLALELMRHVPTYPEWTLPDQSETIEELKSQLLLSASSEYHSALDYNRGQLEDLRSGKERDGYYHQFESPKFPRYNVDQLDDPSTANELNTKLHALLESCPKSPDGITKLLPRICFYLLSSKYPPNIHTYNLLLCDFAGERRHDLIGHLLRSILATHMRPNEITLTETLRHYICTRQCSRFDEYVHRMEGFKEGLGVAAPQLDIPDLLQFQYRVRVRRRGVNKKVFYDYFNYSNLNKLDILAMCREGTTKVYEKPRRNLEVHHILIQGALTFHGMFEAMKHYCTMISEGWQPNAEILLSILHRCVVDCDWDAGIAVWRHMQASNALAQECGYILMLQLCQKANKPELIEELLQRGIQRDVLPPTVLEISWHEPALDKKSQELMEDLEMAKDVWILKQGLEELLEEHRSTGEISHETSRRLDLLRYRITETLRQPNDETTSLLLEARLVSEFSRKFSELDTMLKVSQSQISSIASKLRLLQLPQTVRQLQGQLTSLSCAIAQTINDASSIFFSTCVMTLEDRFYMALSSTTQLANDFHTFLLCGRGKRLRERFNAINREVRVIRTELSSFVASLLGSVVLDLEEKLKHLQARISITSGDVKDVMTTFKDRKITIHNILDLQERLKHLQVRINTTSDDANEVMTDIDSGRCRWAARQRIHRRALRNSLQSPVQAAPESALVASDGLNSEHKSRWKGSVVRAVRSTPPLIRTRRVEPRPAAKLHLSRNDEAQSRPLCQASMKIQCGMEGKLGMTAESKQPLPANASEKNDTKTTNQFYRSGRMTLAPLDMAYIDPNPSAMHELGYR